MSDEKKSLMKAPAPQGIEVRSKEEVGVEEEGRGKEEEVGVECVDHRSYAGDEGKSEDVPVTVVHQIHKKEDSTPSAVLPTVTAKAITTATAIKDTFTGTPNSNK